MSRSSCAIGSPEAAALIGCGNVGCVVGAEALSQSAGVWVKTHFYRKGPILCATVYTVAAGEPKVFHLEVDLRPIEKALERAHTAMHAHRPAFGAATTVGWGLGKLWKGVKNTAKKIGRNKLVRGVVQVTKTVATVAKTVVKSKAFGAVLAAGAVFPLTAPFAAPALGAYAACNAAIKGVEIGKKVIGVGKKAASVIDRGKQAQKTLAAATSSAKAAVASVAPTPQARAQLAARTKAAGKLSLTQRGKQAITAAIKKAPTPAARAAVASKLSAGLKATATARSQATLARSLPPAAGQAVARAATLQASTAPLIAQAARTQKALSNPATKAKLVALKSHGEKAAGLLTGIANKAKTGDLDAVKSAAIVNLVARNRARIQAMSQANAGGMPGLLITPQGRIVRGKFRVQAQAGGQGLLYLGAGKPSSRGSFATVAGELADAASELADTVVGACSSCVGAVVVPLVGVTASLIGRPSGYQIGDYTLGDDIIAGDLPIDGVRLSGRGANAGELGTYEINGCGKDCACGPCQRNT